MPDNFLERLARDYLHLMSGFSVTELILELVFHLGQDSVDQFEQAVFALELS